jgi:hypothetical protein
MKLNTYNRNSAYIIIFFLIITLCSCGEVLTEYPLIDKQNAIIDERLIGSWETSIKEEKITIHISKNEKYRDQILIVKLNINSELETYEFSMITSKVDSIHYMNLQVNNSSVDIDDCKNYYLFAKYSLENGQKLEVYILDPIKVEKYIKLEAFEKKSESDFSNNTNYIKKLDNFILLRNPPEKLKKIIFDTDNDLFKLFGTFTKTG